jgi:hypothetical protein
MIYGDNMGLLSLTYCTYCINNVLFKLGFFYSLDVINTLLRHLRLSIDRKVDDEAQRIKETKFEENIINTIGKQYYLTS